MKKLFRKNYGSVMVESALAIPIFLLIVFGLFELTRALYVMNSLNVAAQQVAGDIAKRARKTPSYNVGNFGQFASQIYIPGAVVNSSQFSFDVVNSQNTSTVSGGQADSSTSTKVIVTVSFPPPNDNTYKIPVFDPGNLVGLPIFGTSGLMLSSQAVCFLERSRRPTLN